MTDDRGHSGRLPKSFVPLERAAREQGWTIMRTVRCHWRWCGPDGQVVFTSGVGHTVDKARNALRRAGLEV